jgi:TnpA family transposase
MLRFPGRTITDLPDIPTRVLALIAQQVGVPPTAFVSYGQRLPTIYEHLDEIRTMFGYRNYDWRAMRKLARVLLPQALESDRPLPLAAAALQQLRQDKVIAPGITTIERLVWGVLRIATRRIERALTRPLTAAQQTQLDALLTIDPALARRRLTRLTWLRVAPGNPSGPQLKALLERVVYLANLALPSLPSQLHRNRIIQLAREGKNYRAQPLAAFDPDRRYALLVAHLHELQQDVVDASLDMFDKVWLELVRKTSARQERQVVTQAPSVNTQLMILTNAADAFLHAATQGLDPIATVFAAVPQPLLTATVQAAHGVLRPVDFDFLDLLEPKYLPLRSVLLSLYRTLPFASYRSRHRTPAQQALDHVGMLAQQRLRVTAIQQPLGRRAVVAPLAHLTDRWRPHVLTGAETINPNYYEASAFDTLRTEVRSGDVAIATSRRYRPFAHYLLPKDRWEELKASGQTRLALSDDPQVYLKQQQSEIHTHLTAIQNDVKRIPGLTLDEQGNFHLARLEPDVPEEARALSRYLYAMLPRIDLPDLLKEVNDWTNFLGACTHLLSGEPLRGNAIFPLLAAIMGTGMNLGLTKLAAATPYTYGELSWAMDWYVREDTLRRVLTILDNFVLHHPFSQSWGTGTRSSSDGLRVRLGVQAANADRNAAHFHRRQRGVTIYLHVPDIGPPYRQQVIAANDSEALYVIDALCHHETDLEIRQHATDTAGATEHVFGLCTLMGFEFTPRISDVLSRSLMTLEPKIDYGPASTLIKGSLNPKPLVDHWDGVRHIAASIRHGTTSATTVMRKLAAYPRQNNVALGLAQVGMLEHTRFTLKYLRTESLRRQVQGSLNNGEAVNSLARALFFGRRGVMRDRAFEDQMHRASCLVVLIAAIAAWNTVYLAKALETYQAMQGKPIEPGLLEHLSPLGWNHINLLGRYQFSKERQWSLDQLRPLRTQAEIDADTRDDQDDG